MKKRFRALSLVLCPILFAAPDPEATQPAEPLPEAARLASMEITPDRVHLRGRTEYAQILVTGILDDGARVDLTRLAEIKIDGPCANIDSRGDLRPAADGEARLVASLHGQQARIPVKVSGLADRRVPDYVRDVMPVLSRLGCNQGTCHGAQEGKNGFKLSLRGYDPLADIRAFTDDHAARRINPVVPERSLMLLKSTGEVPHEGQQIVKPGSIYYDILRDWIAGGAKLDPATPRVVSIALQPANPVVDRIGGRQQFRVVATTADGLVRDVTAEAFIESGDSEIAIHDEHGLLTTLRRGEAPVLARFEGRYATTILTVMGDRGGFEWQEPPAWNEIDRITARKWKRLKILPAELCDDATFLRRVHLDLTGLPPGPDQVRAFLADKRDTRTKRDEVIDQLVGNDDFVDHWANKWADLLQVNRKFLAPEGATAFRGWIRREVADNTPYDEFARKILTASGSNKKNPAASYFKILRTPEDMMENTTHLFLATRFNCNKCHDHPFERWTQDQYYQLAAYFARTGLKKDPAGGDRQIGKTAVEAGKPMFEIVYEKDSGEVVHDRTKAETAPSLPYPAGPTATEGSRREQLAAWITSPDNRYFASSYANRLWGYLTGTGVIEPLDDIRAGNPPSNPELLDHLTREFVDSGFDVRHLLRHIARSRTYQLSIATHKWNEDDTRNYSHAKARRLPAETLYDTIMRVTGATSRFPGVPAGTRAAALPDAGVDLPDGFLGKMGRPVRESACECERTAGMQLGAVMALVSGPTLNDAISDSNNAIAKLVQEEPDDRKLVESLYLRVLNRPPTRKEADSCLRFVGSLGDEHKALLARVDETQRKHEPDLADRQAKRQAAIDAAKTELDTYLAAHAEERKRAEQSRDQGIKAAEQAFADYKAAIPAKLPAWETSLRDGRSTVWHPLHPSKVGGSMKSDFEVTADGAVFAKGKLAKGSYVIEADTDLSGITGFRLEALTDKRLPGKGPGRAQNGNFVVTEFSVLAATDPVGDTVTWRGDQILSWNPSPHAKTKAIDDGVELRSEGNDPYLSLQLEPPPTGPQTLVLRARFKGTLQAQVFWKSEGDENWTEEQSVRRTIVGTEDRARTYRFGIDTEKPLVGLRVDPMTTKGTVVIESIQLVAGATPEFEPVGLENAAAKFSQASYGVATAIDGKRDLTNNGWATAPKFGEDNWATFEAKGSPASERQRLRFVLDHQFQDGKHALGNFRLSATTSARPFGDSLPAEVANALDTKPDARGDKQEKALREFFERNDTEFRTLRQAVADARKPLPEDPKRKQLEQALAKAETPLELHPRMAAVLRAKELSESQLKRERLTAAQDIVWSLCNTPSFTFR